MRILVLVLVWASACRDAPCGEEQEPAASAPRIVAMSLLEQLKDDPWTLILRTDFEDSDGDLGDGRVDFYVNSPAVSDSQPMPDIFRQSGVTPDSKSGSLWMWLRFQDSAPDGALVHLGTRLLDQAGQGGNCYALDLLFDVTETL